MTTDSSFTWQRKTRKKFYGYVTNDDGAGTSNRVVIPAAKLVASKPDTERRDGPGAKASGPSSLGWYIHPVFGRWLLAQLRNLTMDGLLSRVMGQQPVPMEHVGSDCGASWIPAAPLAPTSRGPLTSAGVG